MPNEAIERALMKARHAYRDVTNTDAFDNGMRAAISAYFADVPVSEAVRQAGIDCLLEHTDDEIDVAEIHKAMCAKHAKDLSND